MININDAITAATMKSGIDFIDISKKEGNVFNAFFGGDHVYELEMTTGLEFELIVNPDLNRAYFGWMDDQAKGISMITEMFVFLDFINTELKKRNKG